MRGADVYQARVRRLVPWIALASLGCLDGHQPKARFTHRWMEAGGVRAIVAGGTDGRGGGEGPVLVYLHGFASLPEDQLPLRDGLDVPAGTRFVFPEGRLGVTLAEGPRRAWWLIDRPLRRRMRAGAIDALSHHRPPGLAAARVTTTRLLRAVERELGAPPERTVVAGFSQGAMLACDLALRSERPYAGLGVLSGTLLAESDWGPRMPRHPHMPVFVSHGRADPLLPYAMAERLAARLRAGGHPVRWYAHDAGHEMTEGTADAFSAFVYESLLAPSR